MSTYMEFLHQQRPIDGFYHNVTVTGVPVSIDVIDPNNNYFHLNTVTSDEKGNFAYSWNPTISGQYKITATFAGDESYGTSSATTYAAVTDSATNAPTQQPVSIDAMTNTLTDIIIAGVIAIIIAIAIVGVLILRKRP